MQKFEESRRRLPGPMRIVDSDDELLHLTSQGWGLVFTYQAEVVQLRLRFVPETKPEPGAFRVRQAVAYEKPDSWSGTSIVVPDGMVPTYEHVVVRRQYFVLQQGVEPALAAAAEKADTLVAQRQEWIDKCLLSERELAKEREAMAAVARTLEQGRDEAERLRREVGELRAQGVKLERAIGKLRKELGEARMREILGE